MNLEEAETAFTRILGKRNGLGLINESVLVQEFLVGKEYVIDKVRIHGFHLISVVRTTIRKLFCPANHESALNAFLLLLEHFKLLLKLIPCFRISVFPYFYFSVFLRFCVSVLLCCRSAEMVCIN